MTQHTVCSFTAFLAFSLCHLQKRSRHNTISWLAHLLSLGKIGMIQISIWNVSKVCLTERCTAGEICKNQRPAVQWLYDFIYLQCKFSQTILRNPRFGKQCRASPPPPKWHQTFLKLHYNPKRGFKGQQSGLFFDVAAWQYNRQLFWAWAKYNTYHC